MTYLDQRDAELLRRRLSGETFTTIACELGYTGAAEAAAACARAIADTDPLESAARHEADRLALDELQHAVWEAAASGDLDAVATMLAIHDSRTRRLGMDDPACLDVAGPAVDPFDIADAELDELLALAEGAIDDAG